tara:strand:+ start:9327 stop:9722 length:396 start_codon:yes stop_codon:yes gene_type:complete
MKKEILDILEKHYYGRNFIEDRAADDLLELFGESRRSGLVSTNKVGFKALAFLTLVALAQAVYIYVGYDSKTVEPVARVISLSNTDTIYQEIEVLKLKSDTIIINNEKKINNYTNANTTSKVKLFSERIGR